MHQKADIVETDAHMVDVIVLIYKECFDVSVNQDPTN